MSKSHEDTTTEPIEEDRASDQDQDRLVSRRKMLRGMAAAGGAAAVGTGALPHIESPVQDADAIGITGGLAILGAGAAAALIVSPFIESSGNGADVADSATEDEIHSAASAIESQRALVTDVIEQRYKGSTAKESPIAQTIFAQCESKALEKIANGNPSMAKPAALDELDKRITIAAFNIVQSHNQMWLGSAEQPGLITALVAEKEFSTNQINWEGATSTKDIVSQPPVSNFETVNASQGPGGDYLLQRAPVNNIPADASNIDEIPVDNITQIVHYNGDDYSAIRPGGNPSLTSVQNILVSHPSRNTVKLTSPESHYELARDLLDLETTLRSDLETYVDQVVSQISSTDLDTSDFFSPSNYYNSFSKGDDSTSAVAARLGFSGADIPDKDGLGYQAKVSHADLSKDRWGELFFDFSVSPTPTIKPGVTVSSSDYNLAYFSYTDSNGETQQKTLSGSTDLQILDVSDVPDTRDTTSSGDSEAGANGDLVIWDTATDGEAPDPLQYPADHSGWVVDIEGDVNEYQEPIGNVQTDDSGEGTKYKISGSALAEGETVRNVRLVPPVNYENPTPYVQNPGTVTQSEIEDRLQSTRQTRQAIKDLDSGSVAGGGSLLGDGLPTLPGLGVVESAIVVAAGFLGINALSS